VRLRTILILVVVLSAVGVSWLVFHRGPTPIESPAQPRPFVWSFDFEDLRAITIRLPRDGKSESWVRHNDKYWYFDQPNGPKVDMKRWGGGIPLILSGPGAERLIASEPTADQLAMYGLADPRMRIQLGLADGKTMDIDVGENTPDGQACYVKVKGATDIYTVHHSWYEVLERLVADPPYPR
jgi:hypothetical protein